MSGETIRDVVIRIRMEQQAMKLNPPDVSAVKRTMDDLRRQQATGAVQFDTPKLAKGSTPTGAGGSDPLADLRAGFKQAAQDVDRLAAAQRNLENASRSAKQAIQGEIDALRQGERFGRKSFRDALDDDSGLPGGGAAPSAASAKSLAAQKQQLEGYSLIGSGALNAARSVAYLTAADQDNLEATLKLILGAEALVGAGRGVIQIVRGIITLQQVSAGASRATGIAHGIQAGGATAATAATQGLTAAMLANPALAVAAAVTAAAGAYLLLSRNVDAAGRSFVALDGDAEKAGKLIDAVTKSQSVLLEQKALDRSLPGFDVERAGGLQIQELRDAERQAAFRRSLSEQRAGIFGGGPIGQARVAGLNIKGELEVEKVALSVQMQVSQELERQKRSAADLLNLSKLTLETEKARLDDAQTRFGRLNVGEQERLKDIAKRQQGGEKLNRQDAEFAERAGFGGDLTNSFFREQGQQAGFGDVAKGLGLDKGFEQAKRQILADKNVVALEMAELEEATTDTFREIGNTVRRMKELVKAYKQNELRLDALEADAAATNRSLTGLGLHRRPVR